MSSAKETVVSVAKVGDDAAEDVDADADMDSATDTGVPT